MSRAPASKLSTKHLKALELIAEGNLSIREIANAVGWSEGVLYHLYEGRTEKTGPIGELFAAELHRIRGRSTAKASFYVQESKMLILRKMNEWLREIHTAPLTMDLMLRLAGLLNALSKATVGVAISNSYATVITAEHLSHEYMRLQVLARAAIGRRGNPLG